MSSTVEKESKPVEVDVDGIVSSLASLLNYAGEIVYAPDILDEARRLASSGNRWAVGHVKADVPRNYKLLFKEISFTLEFRVDPKFGDEIEVSYVTVRPLGGVTSHQMGVAKADYWMASDRKEFRSVRKQCGSD